MLCSGKKSVEAEKQHYFSSKTRGSSTTNILKRPEPVDGHHSSLISPSRLRMPYATRCCWFLTQHGLSSTQDCRLAEPIRGRCKGEAGFILPGIGIPVYERSGLRASATHFAVRRLISQVGYGCHTRPDAVGSSLNMGYPKSILSTYRTYSRSL